MPNNRVPKSKRAAILATLVEGVAINSVCRIFSVGKHAVLRLVEETGEACEDWHNRHFRGLTVARLELDEQWNYIHTHRERMTKETKMEHPERGDIWLWAGIDPDSKAVIGWHTGKRGASTARAFARDLAGRVEGRVQITSDQLLAYRHAIPGAFGRRADYAQEKKKFHVIPVEGHEWMKQRVSPLVGVERVAIMGRPDLSTATVCHAERFFLTSRQGNKRCARKTLAYSKKWENHAFTASIHCFVYNMVRRHESIKTTPAMRLGITDKRWTLDDVVAMTDEYVKLKEEGEFEAAFTKAGFQTAPTSKRTYPPTPKDQIPLPWYLDPTSKGPPQTESPY